MIKKKKLCMESHIERLAKKKWIIKNTRKKYVLKKKMQQFCLQCLFVYTKNIGWLPRISLLILRPFISRCKSFTLRRFSSLQWKQLYFDYWKDVFFLVESGKMWGKNLLDVNTTAISNQMGIICGCRVWDTAITACEQVTQVICKRL